MKKYLIIILTICMMLAMPMTVLADGVDTSVLKEHSDSVFSTLSYNQADYPYCVIATGKYNDYFYIVYSKKPLGAYIDGGCYYFWWDKTENGIVAFTHDISGDTCEYFAGGMTTADNFTHMNKAMTAVLGSNYDVLLYDYNELTNNSTNPSSVTGESFFLQTWKESLVLTMARQTEQKMEQMIQQTVPTIVVSGIGCLALLIGLPILVRGLRTFLH